MRSVLLVLALAGCSGGSTKSHPIPGDRGRTITVEVLNASGRPGSARVATRILRQAGIDVVFFGNAADMSAALDSTRIIVRRGDAKVGERVRAVLGLGRVEVQLDTGKLLDVSVLLGTDFAASARAGAFDLHP
jgi:hypothetical protein